jgi:hypothetical protein
VKSPVTFPPAVEAVPFPKPDSSPRVDEAPIPVVNVIKSEAAQELGVAMDANQTWDTEQRDINMDVDEELLSLIADDLPSRHSQNMLRKQEPSLSEIKNSSSSHAPPKQEPVLSTLPPTHLSPGPSSFTIKSERVSTLSPDAAVFTRDPEASTLKPEERPSQKKKVNQSVPGFLLVFLTYTRQNSMHSPKVVPNQAVRQSRSSKYHPMVSRQRHRKAKSHRLL